MSALDFGGALDAHLDRGNPQDIDGPDCPRCSEPLEVTGAHTRGGWWRREECHGCGYVEEDADGSG